MPDATQRGSIQAQLVRPARYKCVTELDEATAPGACVRTRDWALFVFFRIVSDQEIAAQDALLGDRTSASAGTSTIPSPARFRRWLKCVTGTATAGLRDDAKALAERLQAATAGRERCEANDLARWAMEALGAEGRDLAAVIKDLGEQIAEPKDDLIVRPLVRLLLHEFLRQIDARLAPLRGVASQDPREDADAVPPIKVAFTFRGLETLGVDGATLDSFLEPFRLGMAARAQRLGDVGASAPEHWEGELGLPSVHGYIECGSDIAAGGTLPETFWVQARREVRAFNDRDPVDGGVLRELLGCAFRLIGMEIVHIELGQDPYAVRDGRAWPLPQRFEHFGFRDGLSQPFLDLGLAPSPAGGGTPDRQRGWYPVAPGEIFLDRVDEAGNRHRLPVNKTLRDGSTFLVFRKLEQDVAGLRAFLARERPGDRPAQDALAAAMVGRWPGGMPLVAAPWAERRPNGDGDPTINDFRYAADDPEGRRCPLGAHIRRANPRDIDGGSVRNHRILRRGISYGGRLLADADDGDGDGEPRGLLFIAANARIDLQFEVIQADWLNGGEFLGQAGLGRCPLTGAHDGRVCDAFVEAGAVTPVVGLPRFVTTRGGDYFFLPGMPALEKMGEGDPFAPEVPPDELAACPMRGRPLLSPDRLRDYVRRMRSGEADVVRVTIPPAEGSAAGGAALAFVGTNARVREVLTDPAFSVRPYTSASREMLGGKDLLVATEPLGWSGKAHARFHAILDAAWKRLDADLTATLGCDATEFTRETARTRLAAALQRTSAARQIDLADDLAVRAAYAVVERVYGVPGPAALTELAMALPFARKQVGELPTDWVASLAGRRPADPALTSLQLWAAITVANLIGNVQSVGALRDIARKAATELFGHIQTVIGRARLAARRRAASAREPVRCATLVDAFIAEEASHEPLYRDDPRCAGGGMAWTSLYDDDVALLLFEIVGSTLAVIPFTFASAMTKLLDHRVDLPQMIGRTPPELRQRVAERLIYEGERLNPTAGIRIRQCEAARPGMAMGDLVATLIGAANTDTGWDDAARISLGTALDPDAPVRDIDDYLLFGAWPGDEGKRPGEARGKTCWGRDRVAMPVLAECLLAAARLQGLRRVAGPNGSPRKIAEIVVGLPARFTGLLPSVERAATPRDDGARTAGDTPPSRT